MESRRRGPRAQQRREYFKDYFHVKRVFIGFVRFITADDNAVDTGVIVVRRLPNARRFV